MKQELSFKIVEKNGLVAIKQNVFFQKISMPPPWMVFWLETPYPSGNSSLTSFRFQSGQPEYGNFLYRTKYHVDI